MTYAGISGTVTSGNYDKTTGILTVNDNIGSGAYDLVPVGQFNVTDKSVSGIIPGLNTPFTLKYQGSDNWRLRLMNDYKQSEQEDGTFSF